MRSIQLSPIQWIGIVVGSLAVGFVALNIRKNVINQSHYNSGLQAYEQGNCPLAQSELNTFLQNFASDETNNRVVQAKAVNSECNLLTSISTQQQSGKQAEAFTTSIKFAQRYPNSSLMTLLRQKMAGLLANNKVAALVQSESCHNYALIEDRDLIPDANQPDLYLACGQVLTKSGKYATAIEFYEKFLDRFPNHALAKDIKQDYAQALYADVEAKGAGTIPPPPQRGSTGNGSTVVEIRNDAPEKMRIVFGGPTPRVEELEPCTSCQTHIGEPPKSCPNQGPLGRYRVDPGQYRIIVKSVGNSYVTPYTGNWSLTANAIYSHCFYIVRHY